ncbi:MAG: hypothetical protein ACFCUN_00685 [Hyphomicrobiaceae bacterium]
MTTLFILKLTVTPLLVAVMSLIARRWGATVGGLIMGLPWMTGPVLFFLTYEKGLDWCAQASLGAVVAAIAIAGFLLGYAAIGRQTNPIVGWIGGFLGFATAGSAALQVPWTLELAIVAGTLVLLATWRLLPRPRTDEMPRPLPWWDILMRMVVSGLMVLLLSAIAEIAGPTTSGLIASFPVILTSVGLFIHYRWGFDALLRLFRGLSLSLIAFVVFFGIVAATVVDHGVEVAYALAVVGGVATSAVLIGLNRRFSRRA